MSRQLHAVEVPEKQAMDMYTARLVASAVLLTLFTGLVAFAPGNSGANTAPAMTAASTEQGED